MLISILTLVTENKNGKKTDESTLGKGEGKKIKRKKEEEKKERSITRNRFVHESSELGCPSSP